MTSKRLPSAVLLRHSIRIEYPVFPGLDPRSFLIAIVSPEIGVKMYLRLKSSATDLSASMPETPESTQPSLAPGTRARLYNRHVDAFDWPRTTPMDTIKFIDIHRLEYAVELARKGELFATVMANTYISDIRELIIPEHGGACQYSSGVQWNNRSRTTTLAGQALALQAFALGATLNRQPSILSLGIGIHRFVCTRGNTIGLYQASPLGTGEVVCSDSTRLRDNAWYAVALHRFARMYYLPRLKRDAVVLFNRIMHTHGRIPIHFGPGSADVSEAKLDDKLALAAALNYFGTQLQRPRYARAAARLIEEVDHSNSHPNGGCCQNDSLPNNATPEIDIDCTIEMVRICLSLLQYAPNARLLASLKHGLRALFNPVIALTRRPESGILLIAEAAASLPTVQATQGQHLVANPA